jgi:hypothetical protein
MRGLLLAVICVACGCAAVEARAYDCTEKYCTRMESCSEAHHHFAACGEGERDADNDGIPCENVCGKTLEEYRRLRGAASPAPARSPDGASPAAPPPVPGAGLNVNTLVPGDAIAPDAMSCGGKRRCGQMQSCAEARFYLQNCGVRSLDRDGDGVPCESLCGG